MGQNDHFQKRPEFSLSKSAKKTRFWAPKALKVLNYREIFPGHNFGARVNVDIDSDSSGYWDQ